MMRLGRGLTWAVLVWLFAAVPAAAQDGFALSRYRAAPASTDGFGIMLPTPPPHLALDARLALDYAHGSLVVSDASADGRTRRAAIVDHTLAASLAVSLGIENWLGVWVALPVALYQGGDALDADVVSAGGSAPSAQGLGDLELGVRALLAGERAAPSEGFAPSLGASASVLFPTGSQSAYMGDGAFGVRAQVVLALLSSLLTPIAGVGLSYRRDETFLGTPVGPEMTWLLGLHLRQSIVRLEAELRGGATLSGGQIFSGDTVPIEVLLGGHLFVDAFTIGLAVDAGVTQALGTPDVRVIGTFGLAAPLGGSATGSGGGDADGEGDVDGDRDGDGVADVRDECPDEPEDVDQHADDDGCPETDADGDGVADEADFCPDQAETRNGYNDDDGCPDGVEIDGDIIRPTEPVHFGRRSADLDDGAETILRMIVELLRTHDEIALVQVEGHASNDEGNASRTLSLSERRAEAVLDWLTRHGVNPSRLTFAGMGSDVPVEGAEDETVNRRVTFRVLERR